MSPFDLLAEEIGAVAGRIERESKLRIDAILAELRARDAERDLRFERLEREIRDRLAAVRDGAPGTPGPAGTSVTADDVAPMIADEVNRAVSAIPKPENGKSVTIDDIRPLILEEVGKIPAPAPGKSVTTDDVRPMLEEMVAALPKPENGKSVTIDDIRTLVDEAIAKIPVPENGKSVTLEDVQPLLQEMVAALPKPENGKSVTIDDIRPLVDEAVAKIPAPAPGKEGQPGKLPIVVEWKDGVHYEGDCVVHLGSSYQALRDTGREPPHEDWRCIARAGRDGENGRSLRIVTTYDPEKRDYRELDVVALNGGSFVARRDAPGPCPGEGWQLMSAQGKRGQPGEPGKRGEPGRSGDAGPPVVAATANDEGVVTLTNGDGSTVDIDLYPLLAKVQQR